MTASSLLEVTTLGPDTPRDQIVEALARVNGEARTTHAYQVDRWAQLHAFLDGLLDLLDDAPAVSNGPTPQSSTAQSGTSQSGTSQPGTSQPSTSQSGIPCTSLGGSQTRASP